MSLTEVFALIGGLAMFLFGMSLMSDALEKRAGKKLKYFVGTITSNPIKGFLLGLGATLIVQSSSATTVMVVGFVNSGIMTLDQAIGVIMGANLGASVTSWLVSLEGIQGAGFLTLLKPTSFVPLLALIGVVLYMFLKNKKFKDTGMILLGFAVLMFGMEMMSGSVKGLTNNEQFTRLLILFKNPLIGVLIGTVFTAIIQSSGASVAVLQALTATGSVTYATAVPVIMGQNIGTCITALISSFGASKNAKRAAIIHLSFNVIATLIILPVFYLLNGIFDFAFMGMAADYVGIAVVHTGFKLIALMLLMPASKLLVRLSMLLVPEKESEDQTKLLDERFLSVPAVAIARCREVTCDMCRKALESVRDAFLLLEHYDEKEADKIRKCEAEVDVYEDKIGSYLVKLSGHDMSDEDSAEANKLLHVIGNFERISDHAVNLVENAEEIHERNVEFSGEAKRELVVLINAVSEILSLAQRSFEENDLSSASMVEPLEQVVDRLRGKLKDRHIARLRKNECTIELGFVLTDILTNLERVSDHCSNIAGCVLEISHDEMDIHEYLSKVKGGGEKQFNDFYDYFKLKYALD